MSLLDDVMAANAAVVEGSDVPVPAVPLGRRVVVVTCAEISSTRGRELASFLGFSRDEALVFANAGGRTTSVDGDVVRGVVAALALGQGGEVFVIAHEDCEFLESDPDAASALLATADSSMLTAVSALCGESYVSSRKLALASAEMLRSSPFIPRATPVHALVFEEGRGRLSVEQRGYDVVAATASSPLLATSGLGAAPSPTLAAPGPTGFGAPGPVTLFGSGPSSLMGLAPPPSLSPAPDLGAAASAFLAPPAPPSAPPGFVLPPTPTTSAPSTVPPPMPSTAPELKFIDFPPPPPPRPVPGAAPRSAEGGDDPFKKAAETLERLRRARRK